MKFSYFSYLYPNASILALNSGSVSLISKDDPNLITDWYQDRLAQLNFSIKNFVNTNNNHNIFNVMQSAQNRSSVNVKVKKLANEQNTMITVEIN